MSGYKKITKHPITGNYELAEYIDDYFLPHVYGVKFPSEEKVYPFDLIEERQIKNFWAEDVITTLRDSLGLESGSIIDFLNDLNITYRDRWKRDPLGGEGATMEGTE